MSGGPHPAWAGPADGHLWPNEEQRLLLRAALGDGAEALESYEAWRARTDVEAEFSWAAFRLLPLLHANLTRLGVEDALTGRLRGVYRRAWYETHRLLFRAQPALAALRAGGVEVLLLKGAPLVLSYYRNHALRPMSDLDVCVPRAQAALAVRLLSAAGWVPTREPSDDHLRYFHALQMRHPERGELDLHWHVMPETCAPGADDAFWAHAEPLEVGGAEVRQLSPAHTLLHVVVHGVRWNVETPVRWIPDALAVLRARAAAVDWDGLVATARGLRVTHRLAHGLTYLAREWQAPVPAGVLAELGRSPASLGERMEATVILRDTAALQRRVLGWHWSMLADFVRHVEPGERPIAFLAEYPDYLRYRLGLRSRRQLVPLVLRGVGRRLAPKRGARRGAA